MTEFVKPIILHDYGFAGNYWVRMLKGLVKRNDGKVIEYKGLSIWEFVAPWGQENAEKRFTKKNIRIKNADELAQLITILNTVRPDDFNDNSVNGNAQETSSPEEGF